jgi:hypothetical protein
MSTPAQPAAATATAPTAPPSQSPPTGTAAADTVLAAAMSSVLLEAVNPEIAMGMSLSYCRAARIYPAAWLQTLKLVMSMPQERTGASGPASLAAIRVNTLRRAQYAVAAGHRLTSSILMARSRGETLRDALAKALPAERRYFGQHIEAAWTRARAAAQVDSAAQTFGPVLGWYVVRDRRTSAECLRAGGRNFRADVMPAIGWPGAVHNHCRCYAGPAFQGARMIPSAYSPVRMVRAA